MDSCVRWWVPQNPVVEVEVLVAAGEVRGLLRTRSNLHAGPLDLLTTDISLTYLLSGLLRGDSSGWSVRNGSALVGTLVEVRQPVHGRASIEQGRLVRDDDRSACPGVAALRRLGSLRGSAALWSLVVRWRSRLAGVQGPARRCSVGDFGRAG